MILIRNLIYCNMNTDNTKLTLEHDKKYTAELNWDCDCEGPS